MNTCDFTLARASRHGSLIERMFGCEGSRWEGDEYKTLSPLRGDSRIGIILDPEGRSLVRFCHRRRGRLHRPGATRKELPAT